MKESAGRMERLYALQCRMADVAQAERKRIAQQVYEAEQTSTALRTSSTSALYSNEDKQSPWSERQAQWTLAAVLSDELRLRREDLSRAAEAAAAAEHAAVAAREQIGRMLDHRRKEIAREASKREQAQMDDLFAITRVRLAMATSF